MKTTRHKQYGKRYTDSILCSQSDYGLIAQLLFPMALPKSIVGRMGREYTVGREYLIDT